MSFPLSNPFLRHLHWANKALEHGMVVASPLLLSSSSQGWDSSTGLENWTFPRCRRPDNTWNTIRGFFRTAPPKAVSSEPSFSPRNRPAQNISAQKAANRSQTSVWIPSAAIPEGKLTLRAADIEFRPNIWSWGPSSEEQQLCTVTWIYSSSNPTLGTHSHHPQQPRVVPAA